MNHPLGNGRSRGTVPAAWAEAAEALADWALSRLIARKDVYGAYTSDGGQYTAHAPLTRALLVEHFRGQRVIGAHSTSPDNRCLTIAGDIDAHDEKADPERNWACALAMAKALKDVGLTPLILDSNGKGGYHVRAFFKKPVPAAVVYWLCRRMIAQLVADGFPAPEMFPKQEELTPDRPYGNWLRLPGKHHKRPHWSRIYNPETERWLEGEAAVRRLLAVKGDPTAMLLNASKAEQAASVQANGQEQRRGAKRSHEDQEKPDEAKVREAVGYLPAAWAESYGGDRADCGWLGVGMALHDWDTNRSLAVWKDFSRGSKKYSEAVCDAKWATFTAGGGWSVGSIFQAALDAGWKPPEVRAREEAQAEPSRNGQDVPPAVAGATGIVTTAVPTGSRLPRLMKTPGVLEAFDDPHRLARLFVARNHAHRDHPTLVYYGDDFHEYREAHYQVMPDSAVDGDLTDSIKREFDRLCLEDMAVYHEAKAEYEQKQAEQKAEHEKQQAEPKPDKPTAKKLETPDPPRPPTARKVSGKIFADSMRALRSMVSLSHRLTMPCWATPIERAPDPRDILPTKDGLIDLSSLVIGDDSSIDLHTLRVYDPTPAFFAPFVLNYSFNPDAPDPTRWLQFLEEVFPKDPVTQRELQKWFGYLISMDTSQQKMLYLVGRPRSGKGTIGNVITELVGTHNVVSPTLIDLAEPFGLSDCVGKTVMLISDARIGGDDKDLARLQERILKISGEDRVQINRKNRPLFTTKLLTRIVIITNEVPGFRDSSGAFKARMRPLRFVQSFEGREDADLFEKKLKPEMPGILNWALAGRAMLRYDGGLFVPESAAGLVQTLAMLATPIHLFLADCCVTTDLQATVVTEEIYLVYRYWCQRTGNTPKPIQTFSKLLRAAAPEIDDVRLRVKDALSGEERRPPGLRAICLQPDVLSRAEAWERERTTARLGGFRN
jgi:putative DNA primase/helicase